MVHRGPDGFGFFHAGPVALAHRRLAIIDLSDAGRQPMTNEDGTIAIVVNGEIYNHAELRAELEAKGHRFRSASDTEVVVHLYEEVGARTPEFLRGMFAFAVWDARAATLLLARDRFGDKPLYYCERPDGFVFASEIARAGRRPAHARPRCRWTALDSYLALQYVPGAAHDLRRDQQAAARAHRSSSAAVSRPVVRRYYGTSFAPTLAGIGEEEAARRVRETVEEAVRSRLMSDVPLGAFLSGGIDSSIVVALHGARDRSAASRRSRSASPRADAIDNELPYARLVAERYRTDHHELVVDPDMVGLLPSIVRHHGEPFADTSAVPTRYLCEMTRRHVTVALSGDAGDEAFGGYRRYVWAHVAERARPPARRRCVAASRRRSGSGAGRQGALAARVRRAPRRRRGVALPALRLPLLGRREEPTSTRPSCASASRATRRPRRSPRISPPAPRDRHGQPAAGSRLATLPARRHPGQGRHRQHDARARGARAARRSRTWWSWAPRCPAAFKLRRLKGKHILKRAFADLVPREIVERRKKGFALPTARWLAGRLHGFARDLLLSPEARGRGFFDSDAVASLLDRHRAGEDHGERLWNLIVLETWHREMVDGRTRFARDIARRADAIAAASVSTAEGLTFPADRDRAGLASPSLGADDQREAPGARFEAPARIEADQRDRDRAQEEADPAADRLVNVAVALESAPGRVAVGIHEKRALVGRLAGDVHAGPLRGCSRNQSACTS